MTDMQAVLDFWYKELSPGDWYKKNPDLDATIHKRFASTHQKATLGELWTWRKTADGRVAEILVLDQWSRNLYREDPKAWAFDGMALILAQEAVVAGTMDQVEPLYHQQILLPFMHSESLEVHRSVLELYDKYQIDPKYEQMHLEIIERFGRYPHRNAILGRESTPEEVEFLRQPGSSF